jgi:hypothetical protein
MNESQELQQIRNQIAFGLDCKAFMLSALGRFLTEKANNDIEAAKDALAEVDPEDAKAIRKLQNDARCASNFLLWIGEAVTEGENAERTFIEASD